MKSTKTNRKLNVRLLRRIKRHILEEPRRLNMYGFGYKIHGTPSPDEPPCGTVGCIAGWAIWLSGLQVSEVNVIRKASTLLGLKNRYDGLSGDQKRLFYVEDWPTLFEHRYVAAQRARTRAYITAERIEHFIKTGE